VNEIKKDGRIISLNYERKKIQRRIIIQRKRIK
jgi:hypothetical protein